MTPAPPFSGGLLAIRVIGRTLATLVVCPWRRPTGSRRLRFQMGSHCGGAAIDLKARVEGIAAANRGPLFGCVVVRRLGRCPWALPNLRCAWPYLRDAAMGPCATCVLLRAGMRINDPAIALSVVRVGDFYLGTANESFVSGPFRRVLSRHCSSQPVVS